MAKTRINRRYTRRSKYSRLKKAQKGRGALGIFLARQTTKFAPTGDTANFTANAAVKATNDLTFTGLPTAGQTITIRDRVYTFVAALNDTVDDDILIGADADGTRDNTIAAINLAENPNTDVVASNGGAGVVTLTATEFGEASNSISCLEDADNTAFTTATLTGGVDTQLTDTAHGLEVGDGPLQLSNSGGALPAGLSATDKYYVTEVPDANNFKVGLALNADPAVASDAGTGTHSWGRDDDDNEASFELLRKNTSQRIDAETDIDNLA